MSLDVYLFGPKRKQPCSECGHEREAQECVYSANITHNLNKMAEAAGIYKAMWRPEEINIKYARELVPLLEEGLIKLKQDHDYFMNFDSPNGWGKYENFVPFVEKYLEACRKNPYAEVSVSR